MGLNVKNFSTRTKKLYSKFVSYRILNITLCVPVLGSQLQAYLQKICNWIFFFFAIKILKKIYPFSIKSRLSSVLLSFLTEFWVHTVYCNHSPYTGLIYHLEGPVFELLWNFLLVFLELDAPLCLPSSILLHRFFSSPWSPAWDKTMPLWTGFLL